MDFVEFSLNEKLQNGISEAGYKTCTPVQEKVLQKSLEGRDLYVQSQTGTGKTAAYLVSIIQEMLTRTDVQSKKALVMVPTRELAVQVKEEAEKLLKFSDLKCDAFYGGVGYDKQVASLRSGVDIIIGTPGRVIDLQQGNQMDLSQVAFLVIDEADRMFDMGFYPDLRTLIKVLPEAEKRQTMLFSATLNSYVKNLAWEYTRDPAEISIDVENITVDEIDQLLYHVSSDSKLPLLLGIIQREKPESLIIFANTKRNCEVLSKRLKMNGVQSEFLIGDLPQSKRLAILEKFKCGQVKCLVATDVAARGIDVQDLQMVINYDLPNEAENYVHRIGRTARAGKSGKAYTFCSEQDVYSLMPIERYIEKQIPSQVADESLMVEDKSKGVYIRTDNYHEEYNDKGEFGRRRAAEYQKSNRSKSRSHGHRNGGDKNENRGNGRYSSRNQEARNEYRRDRRVFNAADTEKLATMTTEERMQYYKELYGSKSAEVSQGKKETSRNFQQSKSQGGKKNGRNSSGKQGKSSKNQNRKAGGNGKQNVAKAAPRQAEKQVEKKTEKKGLFSKLKSLFSRKNK